jgi:hypothetical protein
VAEQDDSAAETGAIEPAAASAHHSGLRVEFGGQTVFRPDGAALP